MKKKSAKKTIKKRAKSPKASRYSCMSCGLAVTVDNICGCVDACDIICCGEDMKPQK